MLKGKWKAFLILNYVNAAFFLLVLLLNVITRVQDNNVIDAEGTLIAIIGIVLLSFNVLNLYVLKVFYPDRQLKGGMRFLYISGICVWYIVFLMFFFSVLYGVSQIFSNEDFAKQIYNHAALVLMFIISIIAFLIAMWQTQLIKFLKRNAKMEVESIVDSIGADLTNNS
ncbi:MAG TPA: hypothetical protein VK173_06930 [Lacibacter sp.]|nr:hypothetical protein [Lacibacter sp.]